jgi:tetratricopeptide (TPR) repeat protein/tRNA A-37 threonylcarbamoyl transferase component Bud32
MTPELYQRLKPLYDLALEVPGEQRAQFMADACGSDLELRKALEDLLAANDHGTGSLATPILSFKDFFLRQQRSFCDGEVILDRFRIVRRIASGGMGEVYEAEDGFLQGVHVALKTILPHIARDPALQRRFKSEVLFAREVTHSNLCPIYDIFHCEEPPPGFLFLTMKLLPGGTLTKWLQAGVTISVDEGLAILRQLALGLAAIHRAGIIHRDIKPNNIMLDGVGAGVRLWITDFGLARAYETEATPSAKGLVAGTPGYIAPELLHGHPPSQATDLFAFGVVLHEVFTGKKPVAAPDGGSYPVSSQSMAPGVPSYCVQLITECLSDDPKRRCAAFERAMEILDPRKAKGEIWTRRRFVASAAASVAAMAGGAWWNRGAIEDELHPLPRKRFVALLNWPKTSDAELMPMLTGALAAIKSELARVEAFDRDFFVIAPEDISQEVSASAHLKEICGSLGANLVLAASGRPGPKHFELLFRLLDPVSGRTLRERTVRSTLAEITSLPARASQAAASLLGVDSYRLGHPQKEPGTHSAEAFSAFQSAEALMKRPDDTGLDAAIEKYKQAVELDPRYALAHAQLARAYHRYYEVRRDPGALDLARGNADHAVALDPTLVEGYLARAWLLDETGDEQGALDQAAKALALDPSNYETLLCQAHIYTRMNRRPDAEQIFRRILKERPNYWVTYNELAAVLHDQGKFQEATQALRAASVAAPGNAFALSNLGVESLQIGDFAGALETLKRSVALDSEFDGAAAGTSLALRCQGKYAEALPFALKATQLNPAYDTNWLELGDCYSSQRNHSIEAKRAYQQAATQAEQHLQTAQADGPSWMLLALYKVKSGSPQDAPPLIQKAESCGADDMDSQLYKARILELLGKRDDALATLAACFRKGAGPLQIAAFPDMQSLRRDQRYQKMVESRAALTEAGFSLELKRPDWNVRSTNVSFHKSPKSEDSHDE